MNCTELAKKIGKNRSTVSRMAARLGVGTYSRRGLELTETEAKRVAGAVAVARVGNPNFIRSKGL